MDEPERNLTSLRSWMYVICLVNDTMLIRFTTWNNDDYNAPWRIILLEKWVSRDLSILSKMILCNNEKLYKRIQQNYTNTLVTACFMKLWDKTRCIFFCMVGNWKNSNENIGNAFCLWMINCTCYMYGKNIEY